MDFNAILATGGVSGAVIVGVGILYKIFIFIRNRHLHSSCVADLDVNVTNTESNDGKKESNTKV